MEAIRLKKSSILSNKRGSIESSKKLGVASSKKNIASAFSLMGLSQATSRSPNFAKLANVKTINPSDAANKFYDKSIS
jgi:hypothetical protein